MMWFDYKGSRGGIVKQYHAITMSTRRIAVGPEKSVQHRPVRTGVHLRVSRGLIDTVEKPDV